MTNEQLERLGPVARAIVDLDREIASIVTSPVVSLEEDGPALRVLLQESRDLRTTAEQLWGRSIRGNGLANDN